MKTNDFCNLAATTTLLFGLPLLLGTLAAALHHGLTLPLGQAAGLKGAWLGANLHGYRSSMAKDKIRRRPAR